MFINNYISFINLLVLKQNYEYYFYNSIFNNVSGTNNMNIYSSYPYNLSCLDTFVLSSASKSCFLSDITLNNENEICSLAGSCRTIDNRYEKINMLDISLSNLVLLNNCNGTLKLYKCLVSQTPLKILPQILPELSLDILSKIPIEMLPNLYSKSEKQPEICYIKNECNYNNLIINYCDQHSFYQCQLSNNGSWIVYKHSCPYKNAVEKLTFDINLRICNY